MGGVDVMLTFAAADGPADSHEFRIESGKVTPAPSIFTVKLDDRLLAEVEAVEGEGGDHPRHGGRIKTPFAILGQATAQQSSVSTPSRVTPSGGSPRLISATPPYPWEPLIPWSRHSRTLTRWQCWPCRAGCSRGTPSHGRPPVPWPIHCFILCRQRMCPRPRPAPMRSCCARSATARPTGSCTSTRTIVGASGRSRRACARRR